MAIGNKWPELFNINDTISSSADYLPLANTRKLNVYGVKTIQPGIDPDVNVSEATAKNVDLFTFPNGVKLRLKLWAGYVTIHNKAIQGVAGKSVLVKTNATEYTTQSWSIAPAVAVSGDDELVMSIAAANSFGIKVLVINDFTSAGPVVEGISECQNLFIKAFIPCMSNKNPATIRSFSNVYDGNILTINEPTGSTPVDESWLYYPEMGDSITGGDFTLLSYGNLTSFAADLSQGGPAINPEDIGEVVNPQPIPPQDDDPSGPGGGDGNYDPTSDPIDFPGLPTGGSLSSGAVKAFVVSNAIMTAVFNKLWSTAVFDIDTFQKLVEAPLDSLIELVCVPVTPTTSGTGSIKLGNFDTEQAAPVVSDQYITIDCGSKKINRFWGSALDYEPYTRIEVFLPFIGIRELHTDDIMNTTIQIKYNIDIFTGDLTAQIKCGQSVLYKFNGNCKATVPVTARVNEMMQNMVNGFGGVASTGLMGGVPAMGVAAISAAINVAFSKTRVTRTGDISGVVGILDDFVPYLIIHRPVQSLAAGFKNQKGYPSNISAVLSSCSGYTEIEYIHLTGISGATDTELAEIEQLLKSGVII